jgi:hypothetical protein
MNKTLFASLKEKIILIKKMKKRLKVKVEFGRRGVKKVHISS